MPSHAEKKHDEVDDEQKHDGDLQREHPAVHAVLVEELVKLVEGLEFFVDGVMPVGQVETRGEALVDAREVPVAEEFGDV